MDPPKKSVRTSTTFWGSETAARDELERLEVGASLGLSNNPYIRNLTVKELRTRAVADFTWAKNPTADTPGVPRKASTAAKFRHMMAVVERDKVLDALTVRTVRYEDIDAFMDRYRVHGNQNPSPETLATLQGQLRKLFGYAEDWDVMPAALNPTAQRKGASTKVNTAKPITWAPGKPEISLVAANLAERAHYLADMLWVIYRTGMRIEEALALKRTSVDFDRSALTIIKAVTVSGGTREEGDTKSVASTRIIPIHGEVITPLQRLCDRAAAKRCDYVFMGAGVPSRLTSEMDRKRSKRTLHAISYSTWRKHLKWAVDKAVEEHGIMPFSNQLLKHGALTNLLASGFSDGEVASFAGHGSDRIVRNRYDSLVPRDLTAVAETMTERMGDR